MSNTPIDFPPVCTHCGWQLRPPADWLVVRTILATSTTPGARAVLPVVDAELARSRHAHPQDTP